ncbi:MAG: hypothetical protein ACK4ND_13990, partial [Cytophagaceae bacterium]
MKLTQALLVGIISFWTFPAFSQDDITIISSCGYPGSSGVYKFNGMVNGKPSYFREVNCEDVTNRTSCTGGMDGNHAISWSGSSWEWRQTGMLGANCVWLVQICVPNSVPDDDDGRDGDNGYYNSLLASNSADTPTPPCFGWVAESGYCAPEITVCCNITDQFDQGDTTFCNGSGTIESASSQIGLNYYLLNDTDDSVVDGPYEGTGSGITFNTGTVTASTIFTIYASSSVDSAACNRKTTSKITVHPSLDITVTNSSPELTANSTGASYQWLDCDNNYAIISGESGQNFTASATGNYAVEITKNGCTDTSACEAVTITINDVNEAPTDISLSASSVDENVAPNTVVGTLSTTDPDEGDSFTYTLVSGIGDTDNG